MHPAKIPPELTTKQLEIIVRRLADDLQYGEDTSRYVGSGVDYAQSRPFVHGDPVKSIDWKVTARSGKYHVKEYEAVKSVPIYLVVDTSASMATSSIPMTKHLMATMIAGALGLAGTGRQSPVGIIDAGSRKLHYPPSLSRQRVFQWLQELYRHGHDEGTNLAERLDQVNAWQKARSLIIVISDLHDPAVVPALKRIAQRHDCAAIQIEDPAERGRLRGGLFRGVEAETNSSFVGHGGSHFFPGHGYYAQRDLTAAGIDHLLLGTDQPFVAELRWFLISRGGLMHQAR